MVKVEYVRRYGEWSNIYNFLEDKEEHIKIFAEKHGIPVDEIKKMVDECDDKILDLIDSDTDEIQEILNNIFANDEKRFIITYFDEQDETIIAEEWEVEQ